MLDQTRSHRFEDSLPDVASRLVRHSLPEFRTTERRRKFQTTGRSREDDEDEYDWGDDEDEKIGAMGGIEFINLIMLAMRV